MVDREKIIKGLECCDDTSRETLKCEECPYRPDGGRTCGAVKHLHDDALEVLTAFGLVSNEHLSTSGMWSGNCPRCGRSISRWDGRDEMQTYCPKCGLKLLWKGAR